MPLHHVLSSWLRYTLSFPSEDVQRTPEVETPRFGNLACLENIDILHVHPSELAY